MLLSRRVVLRGRQILGRHPSAATLVVLLIHTDRCPLVNDVIPGFLFSLSLRTDLSLRNESFFSTRIDKNCLNKLKRFTLSFLGSIRRAASLISILTSGISEKVIMYLLTHSVYIFRKRVYQFEEHVGIS